MQGRWVPSQRNLDVSGLARSAAKKSTESGTLARATILHEVRRGLKAGVLFPEEIGKHARIVDTALPGKHTKAMYDALNKESD